MPLPPYSGGSLPLHLENALARHLQPISFAASVGSEVIGDGRLALPAPLHKGASLRWQTLYCGFLLGIRQPIRRVGSLNPESHRVSHFRYAPLFRGLERLASVLRISKWWRLNNGNTCRQTHLSFYKESKLNAEWRALRP